MRGLKFLFKLGLLLAVIISSAAAGVISYYAKDLPDYTQLTEYQPSTITRLYTENGSLLAEYAREKRIFVPLSSIPMVVRNAFVAAEDRNFYTHPGIDARGILRAIFHNLLKGEHLQGASTITQQVAKNMLLTQERTLRRKIREIILAVRISRMYTKTRVLELYLNEIYLGAGAYGVAAASFAYFNKPVTELTAEEAALLAALPKAPTTFNPWNHNPRALERRNWILAAMAEEHYLSRQEAEIAIATPIHLEHYAPPVAAKADFFAEEVRRSLLLQFGEKKLYEDGLSVHTTLDLRLQTLAETAFRNGLVAYTNRHGYRGSHAQINMEEDWQTELSAIPQPAGIGDWKLAVVLANNLANEQVEIGLPDGNMGFIPFADIHWAQTSYPDIDALTPIEQVLVPGEVILVQQSAVQNTYELRQLPLVDGALVAMEPKTGKVLAMVGGFSADAGSFNRATQAQRQPGSAFKPFVYLAALENGFTPASRLKEEALALPMSNAKDAPTWSPENSSGTYHGLTTLRIGLEKSLNVLTVQLAANIGLKKIIEIGQRFGIASRFPHELSTVLGTTESNLITLTNAYAILANGGYEIKPTLIDYVTNRHGEVISRDERYRCNGCNSESGKKLPSVSVKRNRIVEPIPNYQLVSMLQGAVERGTGVRAKVLERPVAGKTGTTNDSRDAWFIGFTPQLAVGVYVGYDIPKSLGAKEQGASVALPIFVEFMQEALKDVPPAPFSIPKGIELVEIDAKSGGLPTDETPISQRITEAFKAGTEPTGSIPRQEELPKAEAAPAAPPSLPASMQH